MTQCFKVRLRVVGDETGQGGLPGPGWSPQEDRRKQAVCLDGPAEQPALADDPFLPDELIQRARPHSGGQGGLRGDSLVERVFEKVHWSAVCSYFKR